MAFQVTQYLLQECCAAICSFSLHFQRLCSHYRRRYQGVSHQEDLENSSHQNIDRAARDERETEGQPLHKPIKAS